MSTKQGFSKMNDKYVPDEHIVNPVLSHTSNAKLARPSALKPYAVSAYGDMGTVQTGKTNRDGFSSFRDNKIFDTITDTRNPMVDSASRVSPAARSSSTTPNQDLIQFHDAPDFMNMGGRVRRHRRRHTHRRRRHATSSHRRRHPQKSRRRRHHGRHN